MKINKWTEEQTDRFKATMVHEGKPRKDKNKFEVDPKTGKRRDVKYWSKFGERDFDSCNSKM